MNSILSLVGDITNLVVKLSMLGVRILMVWAIVALFIPGIVWVDHIYSISLYLFVYPAGYVFDLFMGFKESIVHSDFGGENPIANFVYLLGMLGSIGLALALPLLYWFIIAFITFDALTPRKSAAIDALINDPEVANNMHLLNGRTTISELYEADVQANAIASALKK